MVLVEVSADGIQRFYGLTEAVSVKRNREFEEVTIRASDGCSVTPSARI